MKYLLFFLCIFCVTVSAQAAHFEYAGGTLWSQVGGWAEDADESDPVDNPGTPWREQNVSSNFNENSVHSFTSSSVSSANCAQDGTYSAVIAGSGLTLTGTAAADANVFATDGILYSYAGFATVQAGVTNGMYYKIMPDAGESEGDLATINITLTGSGSVTGEGVANFGGGGMGYEDVLIAVNIPIPSPNPIEAEHIAYIYPEIQGVTTYNVNDSATIKVKVGHTIAIFLGAGVTVNLGPGFTGNTDMTASAQMTLDIVDVSEQVSVCEECDLDGSGKIDLGDMQIIAAAWLTDSYPFPPPPPGAGESCETAIGLFQETSEYGFFGPGESVWYKLETYDPCCYTIYLTDCDTETAIEIYDECGEYITAFDLNGCDSEGQIQVDLDETWAHCYIRVRGANQYEAGDFDLHTVQGCSGGSETVGADLCENAPVIEIDQFIDDDTTGATGVDETMECGWADDNRDLWYKFIAPYEGFYIFEITFDYMSSNFDGTLSTWDGCGGWEYSCTEMNMGGASIGEFLLEDEEIWVRVGSYEGSEGEFSLTIYEEMPE